MIRSLGILGAGNAGLISALMLRACFTELPITVIKSNKIGAIGVGEGSNEHWDDLSKITNISVNDIIVNAGATFKHGIKFVNWKNGNDIFYHSLPEHFVSQDSYTGLPFTLMNFVANNVDPEKIVFDLAIQGKIAGPLGAGVGQFHFDTFKLNSFLEKLCIDRNIKIVLDTVVEVKLSEQGFVQTLIGENQNHQFEFYIDTTGFERVIHKSLGSKWESYQKYLPTNSAIAFPSPLDNKISTFTTATARQHGWSWQAPVQGRYGNGYVFNKNFADINMVIAELQVEYKDEIKIAKVIDFTPGKIDKFWIKNCVAVGLSGSFIEPLEASSIGATIEQIKCLASSLICWSDQDNFIEKKYNKTFDRVYQNILDFVQLHYLGQRTDTEFWRWCKNHMILTDFNRETVDYFKDNFVSWNFFHENNYELFDELDWIQVMHGLGLFNITKIKEKYLSDFRVWQAVTENELSRVPSEKNWEFLSHEKTIELIKEQYK